MRDFLETHNCGVCRREVRELELFLPALARAEGQIVQVPVHLKCFFDKCSGGETREIAGAFGELLAPFLRGG